MAKTYRWYEPDQLLMPPSLQEWLPGEHLVYLRIIKGADGFLQGDNCQIAVQESSQLIVGQTVTQEANDKE